MNLNLADPISRITKRNNDLDSIVDWFNQHKESFYVLGWSYLPNHQKMEELFYQTIIKVHKELPSVKRDRSFKMAVTSIFIKTCRELSGDSRLRDSETSELHKGLFKELDQLKEYEKDAMVLIFVQGLSREETAQVLQVSEEKVKDLLFAGIRSLRNEIGQEATFNGCKDNHKYYIDYLDKTLDRPIKIDLEMHLFHCPNCQEDLATFQDVMLTLVNLTDKMEDLQMPSGFIESIKNRLEEKEKVRQLKYKKRKKMGLFLAGVIALLIGLEFITGTFTDHYYTWTEENQELRAFFQHDLGERLNLVAESDGVKIRIKSAIADNVQTLIFYEIEDTQADNQYMLNFYEGVTVENQHEIMSHDPYQMYYFPSLEAGANTEVKNVFKGKISLPPITTDNGNINLKITKLQKFVRAATDQAYQVPEFKAGEWNFDIPVTKKPSTEYVLDQITEVEGVPVQFEKLIIAPTTTILQYGTNVEQPKKRIDVLNFDTLEVNNKKVKVDTYSRAFFNSQRDSSWHSYTTRFETLFGEKPKEIIIQLASVQLTFEDPLTIELDPSSGYPQTFEYAGSTISIDKLEIGQPTNVIISNHDTKNRAYDNLHFNIVGEDQENSSMEMNNEGVLIDKNGVEYDMNSNHVQFEKLEQPRLFLTVQNMKLHSHNPNEKVIPKRLEIYGYNATRYLDDVVKITLE